MTVEFHILFASDGTYSILAGNKKTCEFQVKAEKLDFEAVHEKLKRLKETQNKS